MSNLQLFTEPGGDGGGSGEGNGAGAGGEPGNNGNTTMSFDDFLKLEGNQSEFDRRVQKAIDTAVTNAQTKWKTLTDDKVSEEKPFDTIKIEKYRKGVSLEAISEKGYEAAVQDTDDEFKSDLQNVVTDKFYAQLKAGSLTGHETTWQMAVAMAIGKVVAKFQKMKRTATGVAVWVNTLDVYKYLGASDITLQTAFGFKYLTDFLGADVVFVTSEIPQNVVIATPLNNMIAYYVDPGDSEFVKAGLSFTTDSKTGFIGFHTEGTYSRMISDNFAIMGLRLFCEYLDAIAYISVGESDTQTLGTLNVTSEAGSEAGTTKLTVKEQLMSMRNCWKYKDAAAATAVTYGMDVKNWSKWDGESEIVSTATHHITLVECDQNYKAVRSGDVAVTVNPGA